MTKAIDTTEAEGLWREGATFVEVLPASAFASQHVPGARNIPLPELTEEAARSLPADRPIVVYCFDTQCDLSARGAARLEQLGHAEVHDYVGSKAAWMAAGLPVEGTDDRILHASDVARADVPTCAPDARVGEVGERIGDWPVCVVVDGEGVVLGTVRADALGLAADTPIEAVLQPGPSTVRPSIPASELLASMDDEHQDHVLVSTFGGVLIGLVTAEDLRAR
ncbi:MAG: CBS domain-containing protein [Acidimicrobiia bacterium]|nr:CBS domain-containing protein [Acidimicrobiia bacterium]